VLWLVWSFIHRRPVDVLWAHWCSVKMGDMRPGRLSGSRLTCTAVDRCTYL